MMRVVAVGRDAWSLDLLRRDRRIEAGDLVISWEEGQASALDQRQGAAGRDVGNMIVQRRVGNSREDAPHMITFTYAFFAFHPEGVLHTPAGALRWSERPG
jgi:hypothetical protein